MAWIESHQALGRHPKLLRLAGQLRIHRAQALGHLHFLWWWALDYAPYGDVSALTSAEIAAAAEWPGDVTQFDKSLRESGWIDDNGHLHDWMEYAGKLVERRQADRDRKRVSVGIPSELHRNSRAPNSTRLTQPKPTAPPKPSGPEATSGKPPEKAKTDVQNVVLGFKIQMGVSEDDKGWDRVYFPRFSKPAKELLILFGDVGRSLECIEAVTKSLAKKNLSWTPETIVNHASDWKNGRLLK
jgi:hypothetical protein